jgi:hypothetical protein
MNPVAFACRWDRVDEQLLAAVQKASPGVPSLIEATKGGVRPPLLADVVSVPAESPKPSPHYGKMTTLLWWFVYRLFVGGNGVVMHPQGFEAKSVLLADVFEKPIA